LRSDRTDRYTAGCVIDPDCLLHYPVLLLTFTPKSLLPFCPIGKAGQLL